MTTAGERGKLRLGVVGYCPPTRFDETKAVGMVQASYNAVMGDFPGWEITVVSGLTNVGVLRLAYEEAKRRGWRTAGVACEKAYALRDQWFPVDEEPLIVGKEWGGGRRGRPSSVGLTPWCESAAARSRGGKRSWPGS